MVIDGGCDHSDTSGVGSLGTLVLVARSDGDQGGVVVCQSGLCFRFG